MPDRFFQRLVVEREHEVTEAPVHLGRERGDHRLGLLHGVGLRREPHLDLAR